MLVCHVVQHQLLFQYEDLQILLVLLPPPCLLPTEEQEGAAAHHAPHHQRTVVEWCNNTCKRTRQRPQAIKLLSFLPVPGMWRRFLHGAGGDC